MTTAWLVVLPVLLLVLAVVLAIVVCAACGDATRDDDDDCNHRPRLVVKRITVQGTPGPQGPQGPQGPPAPQPSPPPPANMFLVENTVFVDTKYYTTPGMRENPAMPFQTLALALAAAQPGDTVFVRPATYVMTASLVLRPDINWSFAEGVILQSATGVAIFTDLGATGPLQISMTGFATYIVSNPNSVVLQITKQDTAIQFQADDMVASNGAVLFQVAQSLVVAVQVSSVSVDGTGTIGFLAAAGSGMVINLQAALVSNGATLVQHGVVVLRRPRHVVVPTRSAAYMGHSRVHVTAKRANVPAPVLSIWVVQVFVTGTTGPSTVCWAGMDGHILMKSGLVAAVNFDPNLLIDAVLFHAVEGGAIFVDCDAAELLNATATSRISLATGVASTGGASAVSWIGTIAFVAFGANESDGIAFQALDGGGVSLLGPNAFTNSGTLVSVENNSSGEMNLDDAAVENDALNGFVGVAIVRCVNRSHMNISSRYMSIADGVVGIDVDRSFATLDIGGLTAGDRSRFPLSPCIGIRVTTSNMQGSPPFSAGFDGSVLSLFSANAPALWFDAADGNIKLTYNEINTQSGTDCMFINSGIGEAWLSGNLVNVGTCQYGVRVLGTGALILRMSDLLGQPTSQYVLHESTRETTIDLVQCVSSPPAMTGAAFEVSQGQLKFQALDIDISAPANLVAVFRSTNQANLLVRCGRVRGSGPCLRVDNTDSGIIDYSAENSTAFGNSPVFVINTNGFGNTIQVNVGGGYVRAEPAGGGPAPPDIYFFNGSTPPFVTRLYGSTLVTDASEPCMVSAALSTPVVVVEPSSCNVVPVPGNVDYRPVAALIFDSTIL